MASFQLWSDLHSEIWPFRPPPGPAPAPVLILAGDIGAPGPGAYTALLRSVAPLYRQVFVLAGNHEYYNSSLSRGDIEIERACRAAGPHVTFLNNSRCDLPADLGFRIVGSTLWSHVEAEQSQAVRQGLNDYALIAGWDVARNNALHLRNVAYLQGEIEAARRDGVQLVVATHHAPLAAGASHPDHLASMISSAFQTDLSGLMGLPVALWCFGHTHYCSDQVVNGTRVVSNQRGYPGEGLAFDASRVYRLE